MRRHSAAAALVAAALLPLGAGCASVTAPRGAGQTHAGGTASASTRKKATATPSDSAKALSAAAQQAVSAAVAPRARDDDGQVAVAVDDLTTGAEATYAGTQKFVTASIVKVDILSTALYQAQESGQSLSSEEQALATTMIENSDNDAATDLYDDDNGATGIDTANKVFGLTQTTVGTAGYWGLTETTVEDQIRLLRLVFTQPSKLTAQSQDYIKGLMSQVEADQQWGVPAAADSGTSFMVKNGWLPSGTTGLWEINSIGEVVHNRQRMLIAVLSEGNATEDSGISLVQTIAQDAASAMAGSQR